MSLLPGLLRFIVNGKWLIVIFLFSIYYSLFSGSVLAQPGPPDPAPCKNPEETFNLTDNYLTDFNKDQDGGAPITIRNIIVTGGAYEEKTVEPRTFTFRVDFSNLQALFGIQNSNYLEGKFQDQSHQQADLMNLNSSDLNQYSGVSQKSSPKYVVDLLRKNYVEYVYSKPTLAESDSKYTDIAGQGEPKTIYDLVTEFGLPNPPQADEDRSNWLVTWGRYWPKIPTSYTEFYEGELAFHWVLGDKNLKQSKEIKGCPPRIEPPIRIVLPEFFRTTLTSDHLNLTLVPRAAQSYQDHDVLTKVFENQNVSAGNNKNLLAKIAAACWNLITNPTIITDSLKKVIKISFNFINPIKNVLAQEAQQSKQWCIKSISKGKEDQAPYCPLPLAEVQRLGSFVSCSNKNDPNKLETDNPNVDCLFTITWPGTTYQIDPEAKECSANPDGTYTCTPILRIWPNLRIPYLSEIWNNSLYSDDLEEGAGSLQETGRPGVYTFFTPQSVTNHLFPLPPSKLAARCESGDQNACRQITKEVNDCLKLPLIPKFLCLAKFLSRNLPGKVPQSSDVKERFVGAVDCSKEFVRDVALKPKALQQHLGIKAGCEVQ